MDESKRRAFSIPMPQPSAVPMGQAHSDSPHYSQSTDYDQSFLPFSWRLAHGGDVMLQNPSRHFTAPMLIVGVPLNNGSTHSSRAPPASSGQWSLIRGQNISSYSPEIPPFALGTHHARQFSHQEGSQYAELWSESPPSSWIRGQDPLQQQPLSQSQKWEAFSGFKDYPRSLSPPMQHSATYDPPLPSAPSITYPSNNDHGRRHQATPRSRQVHAATLQNHFSQASPAPPSTRPPPIAHSTSGPVSTSHSGPGTRQSSVYVSGIPVPYNDKIEHGADHPQFPEAQRDHPPLPPSHKLGHMRAAAAVTLPPLLSANDTQPGRWAEPGTQSIFGNRDGVVFAEPELIGDGSNRTTRHILPGEGTKKALVVGIKYTGQEDVNELSGCINDACLMAQFLVDYGGYLRKNIVVLSDDDGIDADRRATKENILRWMDWLVVGAKATDLLFFHFSGHGIQVKDTNGDESLGYDDAILPVDHKEKGPILDDHLNSTLVKRLPKGCRLTALVDACHSGTSLDLPFEHFNDENCTKILDSVAKDNIKSKGTEADVVSFSSCKDDEECLDTTQGDFNVGAMTSTFIDAYKPDVTYRQFLGKIGTLMSEVNSSQKPQLGASHKIDLDAKFTF